MPVPPPTTITGTTGDDNIPGTASDDVIDGLEGNDSIDGLGGSDWVTYQNSLSAVEVTFGATGFGFASGGYGDDNLTSIENVIGSALDDAIIGSNSLASLAVDNIFNGLGGNDLLRGGLGNDTLYGGDGEDTLYGQQGDDALYGEAGNDFMRGGTGNDVLDGGSGFDRVSFFPTGSDTITGGVTVSLMLQGVAQDTGQGMDTLIGIEALSGTPFNDSLTGDNNNNWLVAADTDGISGDDQLYGLGGNDLLEVGGGNHVLDGGADNDTLSFHSLGFDLGTGVTASLLLQGAAQTTGIGSMTISNVENLSGTRYADTLIGDGNANAIYGAGGSDTLRGGAGDDVIYGDALISAYSPVDGNPSGPALYTDVTAFEQLAGDDIIEGGLGDDVIDGGAGVDTASYANASGDVSVFLGTVGGSSEGADGSDTLLRIENVTGSAFNDSLSGNNGDNVLDGGAGHDLLFGRSGSDTLLGGDGDDFLRGSDGDDVMNGGTGWDRVSNFVAVPTVGVRIDLNIQGVAQNTNYGMDTLIGIEHASGTILSDVLIGSSGDNWLWNGSDGDDSTIGTGDDQISAGGGNDLVEVGNGNHTLDGGTGTDTLSFLGGLAEITADGVTFSLALQGAAQLTEQGSMTASGFENVSGSIYDDIFTGNSLDNILLGDFGNDSLSGGDGNDTLYGDGRLWVDTHGIGGSGAITLFKDAEASFAGELRTDGDDTLNGGKGADTLYGARGNDVMTGGQGNDRFIIESLSGDDVITDFKNGDKVVFDPSSGVTGFAQLTFTASGSHDTLVTWGTDDSILIQGMRPSQLAAGDFQFGAPAALADTSALFAVQDFGMGDAFAHVGAGHGMDQDMAAASLF